MTGADHPDQILGPVIHRPAAAAAMHGDQHLVEGAVADAAVAPRVCGGDSGHGAAISAMATGLSPSHCRLPWGEDDRVGPYRTNAEQ